jgi:predicted small lipoprotein YifL
MRNVLLPGAVVVFLLASACGQKGPLILPDAQQRGSAKQAPAAASQTALDANDPAADAAPASAAAH